MDQTQEQIIAKVKGLAAVDENIAVVWLYGSRAANKANTESDYDF